MTIPGLERHVSALNAKGRAIALRNGHAFVRNGWRVAPFGPVCWDYGLPNGDASALLRQLGGLWLQWTEGFEPKLGGLKEDHQCGDGWYAVICRRHTLLEDAKSGNTRSKLRRAIKNCDVRKVPAREIAENGFETYCAAFSRYRGWSGDLPTKERFKNSVLSDSPFDDIRHQWAVYVGDRMVGFAQVLAWGRLEADYTLIKLDPDYLKFYSGYALIYRMNEYYLFENGFRYVSDGFRSVLHETAVQDFLITKFGFERAYTRLNVRYRFPLGGVISAARPFRKWISRVYPGAAALMELDRLRVR